MDTANTELEEMSTSNQNNSEPVSTPPARNPHRRVKVITQISPMMKYLI